VQTARRSAVQAPRPAPVEAAAVAAAPPADESTGGAGPALAKAVAAGTGRGAGAFGGAGGDNVGRGGGAGSGADGLRVFCATCPSPEYPSRARRQGWQGTVDVELAIAADGSVRDARVGRSSGYPSLDDVALDVARRSRFSVPSGDRELRGQLRYRFVLDATAASR
jgi:protein TonB